MHRFKFRKISKYIFLETTLQAVHLKVKCVKNCFLKLWFCIKFCVGGRCFFNWRFSWKCL